jgi:SET domain-containing protein
LAAVWEGSCSLGGERWDGKEEEGETEEESVGRWVHIMVFPDRITDAFSYFQINCIPRRRHRQYIPTELPTEKFRRYIPTNFETELLSSVYITDGTIPSVIPLVFSGFLVVKVV